MKLNAEQEANMLSIYQTYEEYFRNLRKLILRAFDIYKINVQYGIEEETESRHLEIISWYNNLLLLNEEAIDNIPNEVKKYM